MFHWCKISGVGNEHAGTLCNFLKDSEKSEMGGGGGGGGASPPGQCKCMQGLGNSQLHASD